MARSLGTQVMVRRTGVKPVAISFEAKGAFVTLTPHGIL
jgi:hypothetical protein